METPISLSLYFVNKQNVRSYGNLIKTCLLKSEDGEFLKNLFESEDYLVRFLTEEHILILSTIKTNVKRVSQDDFKHCFTSVDKTPNLHAVDKELIFQNCWTALNDIVPRKLFGGNQNIKVFMSLVKAVVYSMKNQHFLLRHFVDKWDFSVPPWRNLLDTESKKILHYILIWMIKNILSAMICLNFYVTTCKVDADENKLHYFWKNQWQSVYDKKISDMIFTKVLKKCQPHSLGKKSKRNHSHSERLKLKSLKKDTPKLHLVLKANKDFRAIVRYRNNSQTPPDKLKMKERLKFLRTLASKPLKKIEVQFAELQTQWFRSGKPKLYFVKTDLSDAFGSVIKEKLLRIMSEKHMAIQKMEKNDYFKKKMAQHYKELITELRSPLLVRAGSTVFEWNKGLVQGYKYSPALSELYYAALDELYFSEHLKKSERQIKLFTRVVDDYFYITDSLEDAHAFLDALSNYRNVNYSKTVVNFEHSNIKYSEEITFLGYSYNTKHLQVSRATNVFVGQMCYKIAFTGAISNVQQFLENRIGQSGIQINSHIFNFVHNTEELLWKHIFTTFCLSANKFCTILAVLCAEKEMLNHLILYKKRVVVKLSNSIQETLLRNKPVDYQFVYCMNHMRHLAWKALYLCAKGTSKCSGLVPQINDELAKTNCLFGKWRDHACAINTNGEPIRPAIKDICRRSDLRAIVKQLNKLPDGFECYNHRNIK